MKLKSQKGITLVSLVVYVASFLIISTVIASITTFFYNNNSLLDTETYSASEYNKFNMYFAKETEEKGNRVLNLSENGEVLESIQFSNGDKFTFDQDSNVLYFNKIALCEDVKNVKMSTNYNTGKERIKVKIEFSNKAYSTEYTMVQ